MKVVTTTKVIVPRRMYKFVTIDCDYVLVRQSNNVVVVECVPPTTDGARRTSTRVKKSGEKVYLYKGINVKLSPGIYALSRERGRVTITRV